MPRETIWRGKRLTENEWKGTVYYKILYEKGEFSIREGIALESVYYKLKYRL